MKTKIRDILIISAILFGLVGGLAFVFGCKDENSIATLKKPTIAALSLRGNK